MMFLIFWLALSIVAGLIASGKGRSGVGFFFLALLLSPLVGIITALVVRGNAKVIERDQIATGSMKKCPFCAEVVKAEAIVCRYCGRSIGDPPVVAGAPVAAQPREQPFGFPRDPVS